MKVQIICENCNSIVELSSSNMGKEATLNNLGDKFNVQEVDLEFDYEVDEIEDVTAKLETIRLDCKSCNNFIVLKDFDY